MAHIRFSIQVDTEDEEPSRVVRKTEGTVYECEGESDTEKEIGDLRCFLVQPGLVEEKQIHLFDAMESISDETAECYEVVFGLATNEWNADIEDLYAGGPVGIDLLFIEHIRLDERHRGKGIGRSVVREIIETFGLQCGLVACEPFPLEYSGWAEQYSVAQQAEPDFDRKEATAFEGVRLFWQKCGFLRLPGSDFFANCPELLRQPDRDARKTSPARVPRGRRRLIRGRNRWVRPMREKYIKNVIHARRFCIARLPAKQGTDLLRTQIRPQNIGPLRLYTMAALNRPGNSVYNLETAFRLVYKHIVQTFEAEDLLRLVQNEKRCEMEI